MEFSDRHVLRMTIQVIELMMEYDLCDIMPPNIAEISRQRVAGLLCTMFTLSKAANVRNKILTVIKKHNPEMYLKGQYLAANFDKIYDEGLHEEMIGEVGDINHLTQSIIDKLSKMDK